MTPAELENLRRCAEKMKAGLELTDAEREQVLAAMKTASAVFGQIRRAFGDMAQALIPALQQMARSLANLRQDDFALAPPPADAKGRRRGPGRRGRAAQRSPYGPQRRR